MRPSRSFDELCSDISIELHDLTADAPQPVREVKVELVVSLAYEGEEKTAVYAIPITDWQQHAYWPTIASYMAELPPSAQLLHDVKYLAHKYNLLLASPKTAADGQRYTLPAIAEAAHAAEALQMAALESVLPAAAANSMHDLHSANAATAAAAIATSSSLHTDVIAIPSSSSSSSSTTLHSAPDQDNDTDKGTRASDASSPTTTGGKPSHGGTDTAAAAAATAATAPAPSFWQHYFHKWRGVKGSKRPPRSPLSYMVIFAIGSFFGILVPAMFHFLWFEKRFTINEVMLIPPFGASAVLLFANPMAPLAQPRNVFGGHLISAFMGVCVKQMFGDHVTFIQAPLAMCLAMFGMLFAECVHPPGGATALFPILSASAGALGFSFVLQPVLTGATVLLFTALVYNNFTRHPYPQYWIG